MDARKYIKKVHLRDGNKAKCGAHLSVGALFTEDRDHVTCKNCLTVMDSEKEEINKYPRIEITKDKMIFVDKTGPDTFVSRNYEFLVPVTLKEMVEMYEGVIKGDEGLAIKSANK